MRAPRPAGHSACVSLALTLLLGARPASHAAGDKMSYHGLADALDRADVVRI